MSQCKVQYGVHIDVTPDITKWPLLHNYNYHHPDHILQVSTPDNTSISIVYYTLHLCTARSDVNASFMTDCNEQQRYYKYHHIL